MVRELEGGQWAYQRKSTWNVSADDEPRHRRNENTKQSIMNYTGA